jgi:hypothetical protein
MANRTLFRLALDHGVGIIFLVESVKSGSRFRINGSNFDELPMINPADVNVIVEINRTRPVGRDLSKLEAGLRKYEGLG